MEIRQIFHKFKDSILKYKYIALVLLIGIGLMLIPNDKEENTMIIEKETVQEESRLEDTLSRVLSKMYGAGKVEVLLNIDQGAETIYQADQDISNSDTGSSERSQTVTLTDGQRNEHGLIQQVNPPVYLGAIILCQGADNPAVKLNIVDAVSKITGLKASEICVLKMV